MNKKILLAIAFFSNFLNPILSQINNGIIEYGVKSSFEINENDILNVQKMLKSVNEQSNRLILTLNFNKNESYFYLNPILTNDYEMKGNFNSIELLQIEKGAYCNKLESKYKILKSSEVIGDYSMNFERKSDWILSNDTKTINGYLCFKATSYFYNSSGWVDNPKFNICAWYTTKIPVPIGPNGYHGLPGIILEVQNGVSTIYVKSINLNLDKDPKINNLESFKNLTFQQELDAQYSNMPALKMDIIKNTIKEKQRSDVIQKRIDERKTLKKID